jgi:hypothetical protein
MKTILNEKNVLRKLFKISILNQKKANFYWTVQPKFWTFSKLNWHKIL